MTVEGDFHVVKKQKTSVFHQSFGDHHIIKISFNAIKHQTTLLLTMITEWNVNCKLIEIHKSLNKRNNQSSEAQNLEKEGYRAIKLYCQSSDGVSK